VVGFIRWRGFDRSSSSRSAASAVDVGRSGVERKGIVGTRETEVPISISTGGGTTTKLQIASASPF
jgi:hypothetical protein